MGPDEPLVLLEVAELTDEHVLGDRVDVGEFFLRRTVALDDTAVHGVERRQVADGGRTVQVVVVPRPELGDRARRAERRATQRRDAFGDVVAHLAHGVDLRVEELVDGDEVDPDDVPVDVLQRQLQIEQCGEALLEDRDGLDRTIRVESRNGDEGGVVGIGLRRHDDGIPGARAAETPIEDDVEGGFRRRRRGGSRAWP